MNERSSCVIHQRDIRHAHSPAKRCSTGRMSTNILYSCFALQKHHVPNIALVRYRSVILATSHNKGLKCHVHSLLHGLRLATTQTTNNIYFSRDVSYFLQVDTNFSLFSPARIKTNFHAQRPNAMPTRVCVATVARDCHNVGSKDLLIALASEIRYLDEAVMPWHPITACVDVGGTSGSACT